MQNDLGSQVPRCASAPVSLPCVDFLAKPLGQTEIDQFGDSLVLLTVVQQNILEFDVPMDYRTVMEVLERSSYLIRNNSCQVNRNRFELPASHELL